jgi:amidophosphoribosyltransferase
MCGIIGIINRKTSSFYTFEGLRAVQHRGEESAGILTFDISDGKYREHKAPGLVNEAFDVERLKYLKGSAGLGHTRYPTAGNLDDENIRLNAQPYYVESPCFIAAVQNGQITNQGQLRNKLEKMGRYIRTTGDLEPFLKIFSQRLSRHMVTDDIRDEYIISAVKDIRNIAHGGYSMIFLIAKGKEVKLVAFTSKKKIRPLVYGRKGSSWCFASETPALDVLEYNYAADIGSDEVIIVNGRGGIKRAKIRGSGNAFCMFEWTYFSRPDSVIEGVSVYDVRARLGIALAEKERNKVDVVSAVPNSGYKYAEGYGQASNKQPTGAFYKNDYIGRMFIRPPGERKKISRAKLNPVRGRIKDKSIVLLDDSIVRGETLKRNVSLLKNAGAKEVHLRIGTPKLISPCYYGIDMTTPDQFIARTKNEKQIAKILKADSLRYTSIQELVKAIGKPKNEICLGCLTGKYPTNVSALQKAKGDKARPYEE